MAQGSGGVADEPRIECKMKEAAAAVDGVTYAGSPGTTCRGAFHRYMPPVPAGVPSQRLNDSRNVTKKSLVTRLTQEILQTYITCNPTFKYNEALTPKKFLTEPSDGALNDGYDNENSDLILFVNLILVNEDTQQRYVVKDILGKGTFAQVAMCWVPETNSYVAVKVIKNQQAYCQQALVEVLMLRRLNHQFGPDDTHHIVRMLDHFIFKDHLCISFEMLGPNLYDLIKRNQFKGLSLSTVQLFAKQILHGLVLLKEAGIIHCDLKPENILISTRAKPPEIKIIDLGSACYEGRTVYSYIQSRHYRSPEVLVGYPYNAAIDMWSFGCIIAELFLGLPLFPGVSEYDVLKRMMEMLGGQPPNDILAGGNKTGKFFKNCVDVHVMDNRARSEIPSYQMLTEQEYEARESKRPEIGRNYFKYNKFDDIIMKYPYRRNLNEEDIYKETLIRSTLIDLLRGLLEFDPKKRWSPLQASRHPFITGESFICPYRPVPVTPNVDIVHKVEVNVKCEGGHWLKGGLSLPGHHADGPHCGCPESIPQGHVGSSCSLHSVNSVPRSSKQRCANGISSVLTSTESHNYSASHVISSDVAASSSIEVLKDEPTSSSLSMDPEDLGPHYSDEECLGYDNSSHAAGVINGLHHAHATESTTFYSDEHLPEDDDPEVNPLAVIVTKDPAYDTKSATPTNLDRYFCGSNQSCSSTSDDSTNQRKQGPSEAYSHPEDNPPDHNMHGSCVPSFIPYHISHQPQNSLSHFGQQSFLSFNQTRSYFYHGGHNHFQQTRPICNTLSSLSPARSTFSTGTTWGERTGLPMTTFISASQAMQEY